MTNIQKMAILMGTSSFLIGLICAGIVTGIVKERGNNWVGQNVECDGHIARIVGEVVYEEGDFIVISGYSEVRLGYTGGTIRYEDCEGCSVGVQRVVHEGSLPEYRREKDIEIVRQKPECQRHEEPQKREDMIVDYKRWAGLSSDEE